MLGSIHFKMKAGTLILILVLFFSSGLFAQVYQLPNAGFENWDGTNSDDEPSHWNGFPTAECDLTGLAALGCGTATETRHAKSSDTRPGSDGSYSCKIFATEINILGNNITANGNITTGQIRIGSTTATNAENYNISRIAESEFSQALNAKPDSIVFWAKFVCPSASQEARVNAVIHDSYNYRDPNGSDPNANDHIVGIAVHNFQRNDQAWHRYAVPFNYSYPANDAEYILISFTTNKNAGEGSEDDILYIDDIEMIYNTKLNNILADDVGIPNFNANIHSYTITAECGETPNITAVPQNEHAEVNISASPNQDEFTITVNHGDESSVYTVYVNYRHTVSINDEICQGEYYNLHGFDLGIQTSAGFYTHEMTVYSSASCDTIHYLNLTVNPTFEADTNYLMICNNAEFNFHGQIITEEGIYDTILESEFGCDSLAVLNLSIGDYYRIELNESICDNDVYNENGFLMTESGSDSLIFLAENGCDSLVVLNLSVHPTFETTIYDTTTINQTYSSNGFNIDGISESGDYVFDLSLLSSASCDSIVILNLNVYEIVQDTIIPPGNLDDIANLTIFPNPTSGNVKIDSDLLIVEPIEYSIYNLSGQLVQKGWINSEEQTVDLELITSGIYFIHFCSEMVKPKVLQIVKFE